MSLDIRRSLYQAATGSLFVRVGNVVLALGSTVVLARVLGPEEFGNYAYIIAFITVLAAIAQVGLPNLVVRETARTAAAGKWDLMRGLWRWSNRVVVLSTLAVACIGCLITIAFVLHAEGDRSSALAVAFFIVPLSALGVLRGAALRGLHKVVVGQLPESILRPAIIIALVSSLSLLLTNRELSALDAIIVYLVAAAIAYFIGAWLLMRSRPSQWQQSSKPQFDVAYWTRAAIPLALLTTTQVLTKNTDILILGLFVSGDDVGVYRVVAQSAMLVILGLEAANMVAAPRYAKSHALNDPDELQRTAILSARAGLVVAVPIALVFWFYGAELLAIAFGDTYARGHLVLCIIVVGQLVNAGLGSVGLILNMTGNERLTLRALMISVVVNIVLSLALIPIFGLLGAATATASTLVIKNLMLFSFAHRNLRVISLPFAVKKVSN